MQKSAAAFRTISEVGEILDVPAHVLRFWESKFSQIKPVKRGGGRRYYRPEDIGLIRGIQHLLYEQGLTIKGAQKLISERGVKSIVKMGTELLANGGAVAKAKTPPVEAVPVVEVTAPAISTSIEEPDIVGFAPEHSKTELRKIYDQLGQLRSDIRMNIERIS